VNVSPPARAAASVLAVAVITGVVFGLRPVAPVLSLGVLYVFAVLPVAVLWGLAYALPVSILSMLAFNFFFLPPEHTLALRDSENWVALAVYLVTGVVAGELAARARRRAAESAFAAEVSAVLLEGGHVQEKLRRIAERVAEVVGVRRARIEIESLRRPEGGETTYRLTAGERDVGQLVLDAEAKPDAAVAGRIVPILASLLASAIDRERLGLQAVEAEALRRSDFVKTTILRTLSHDLRSPLTAISAAAEMLDGETLLSPSEREELVASVRVEARRLSRLLSNLLDLSRLEADAARPRLELWTVDGLVARGLEAIGPEAVRVDVSLPAESATVRVDPDQVERVLVNLLENALKYSQGTVELRAEKGGRDLVLRVLDRGPGLDPDELERIFEPFQRGQGGGAGLGLAIARGFAQANGGRLWAEASAGGSCFALALPLAELPMVLRA